MEFSKVATDISEQTIIVVKYILKLNISQADKIARLNKVFKIIGKEFYGQLFTANSELFGSEMFRSSFENADDQTLRLSKKIVQNYNLSRETDELTKSFFDSSLAQAQERAFNNAKSIGKHPSLTRVLVGETCKWCVSKAGTHIDPVGEDFARHENCDCLFIVKGYNSRNGLLTNYVKGKQ